MIEYSRSSSYHGKNLLGRTLTLSIFLLVNYLQNMSVLPDFISKTLSKNTIFFLEGGRGHTIRIIFERFLKVGKLKG